jgi:hypothetical protein
MKKILTLFIALGAIISVQAQSSRSYPNDERYEKDVILGNRNDRYDRSNRTYENNSRYTYYMSADEKDRLIDRIDREYDRRIRRVERDRWVRPSEKSYQIRLLEAQKREEIRQVWERFRSGNNLHRDNSYQRNYRRW